MKFLIKVIRNGLGLFIALIDQLTRWSQVKRSPEQQSDVEAQLAKLSLYQFFACPFCIKTRRALYKLNLPIETRNATVGSQFRSELELGGGAVKVPCLRIEQDGKSEWMYESSQIISYLEKRFI